MRFTRPVPVLFLLIFLLTLAPWLGAQDSRPTRSSAIVAPLPGAEGQTYSAEARTWELRDDEGKLKAELFHVYYRLIQEEGAAERPISFVFNGGPGSSSVWLHLGGLGPRVALLGDEGESLPPPGELAANPENWLRFSDLVFIDPVGTGFSRPAEGTPGKEFYGLEEDLRWVGEFIRLFCAREQRWASPKFLVGESYGTTRAAALADHLQRECDMYLNGVILISPILNFATARFDRGNDLPYACFLPTYAAIAHYHGRAGEGRSLEDFVAEARSFALGDYWTALARGDALSGEETKAIAARLHDFTGIPAEFFVGSHLRLDQDRFRRELLRDQSLSVGRMDGRFAGPERDAVAARTEVDHSLTSITGPYASAVKHYFAKELGYSSDLHYRVLTGKVQPWSYSSFQNRYVNVADRLRHAMLVNPHLQVMICSGYYDLATPTLAIEYTADHMDLGKERKTRLHFSYFPAGHMMYIHRPSLTRLFEDARRFYAKTLAQGR